MTVTRDFVALMLVQALAGCSSSRSPVTPSAEAPSAPVPSASLTLYGYVGDTAFRPLAGVQLEVLSGPDSGRVMTSDQSGAFSYVGVFDVTVSIRATRDGYAAASGPVFPGTSPPQAYISFRLAPLAPAVPVVGEYTLTMAADAACAGLPDAVRTRSYAVSVVPGRNTTAPANTFFDGRVTGIQSPPNGNIFWMGVAADYVTVSTEGEVPTIVEQVGPNRYVAYWGSGGASVGSTAWTTISAPFSGMIEYCELKAPIGLYYDCSPALAAVREQCNSASHSLTLTRR